MDFFFNTSAAVNGFDEYGHYLRTFALVTNCTRILNVDIGGCNAQFDVGTDTASASAVPDEADARDEERSPKSRRGSRKLTPAREREAPGPPAEPRPPPAEGETQHELQPFPEGTSGGAGLRAGRELLRFLMEDGS
jgi:hypothetical protein